MKISIITPSYNMLSYLKLCCASIADQEGADFEHIVVDAESSDGTVEWLSTQSNLSYISEPDNGMYDAINKGLKISSGDILAYLNCDEQYLPYTLSKVNKFFKKNENIDIIFGGFLVVDNNGELLTYRKAFKPRYLYILSSYLYTFSCTMFIRRKIIEDNLLFNPALKVSADLEFVNNILKRGYKVGIIKDYLSTFAYTGFNMSLGETAKKENRILYGNVPKCFRYIKPFFKIARFIEMYFSGGYYKKTNIKYNIYTTNTDKRSEFTITTKSYKWNINNHNSNSKK